MMRGSMWHISRLQMWTRQVEMQAGAGGIREGVIKGLCPFVTRPCEFFTRKCNRESPFLFPVWNIEENPALVA